MSVWVEVSRVYGTALHRSSEEMRPQASQPASKAFDSNKPKEHDLILNNLRRLYGAEAIMFSGPLPSYFLKQTLTRLF